MRTLLAILFLLVMSVYASQVDPLSAFEYARPQTPGLQYSIGILYGLDNNEYDKNGEVVLSPGDDPLYRSNEILTPLRLGYGFGSTFSAGVVVPIYAPSISTYNGVSKLNKNNFGLANPWVWLSASFTGDCGSCFTPRLGFKVPYASYTLEDLWGGDEYKLALGDKSAALDLALLYAYRPTNSNLRLDAQASACYSFEGYYKNDSDNFTTAPIEGHITPGAIVNFALAPGLAYGDNKQWESYLTLNYNAQISDTRSDFTWQADDGNDYYDSTMNGKSRFSAGLRQDMIIAEAGTLHLQAMYDVMVKGSKGTYTDTSYPGQEFPSEDYQPGGFTFGLGYTGYLALN